MTLSISLYRLALCSVSRFMYY